MILSSNIPEAYLLYACFKYIQKHIEESQKIVSNKEYLNRKQDNGIVISISILQWLIEVINFIYYLSYVHFLHGQSNYMDKFFGLYLITFTMIVQPAFYLNGDKTFRTNVSRHGMFKAIKMALFQ